MKKKLTTLLTFISIYSSSNAALLLTFMESGNDVVLQISGSVDVSSGSLHSDDLRFWQGNAYVQELGFNTAPFGSIARDIVIGEDLLPHGTNITNKSYYASSESGVGDFSVSGTYFYAMSNTDTNVKNDSSLNATVTTSNKQFTFLNQTLISMGLDSHEHNTNVGIWRASEAAGEDGTVYFHVVNPAAVPEPSTSMFVVLSATGLAFKRRRS